MDKVRETVPRPLGGERWTSSFRFSFMGSSLEPGVALVRVSGGATRRGSGRQGSERFIARASARRGTVSVELEHIPPESGTRPLDFQAQPLAFVGALGLLDALGELQAHGGRGAAAASCSPRFSLGSAAVDAVRDLVDELAAAERESSTCRNRCSTSSSRHGPTKTHLRIRDRADP